MRITNNMMVDKFLANMQTNLGKMDQYTQQLSSNRKIVRLSDDPVGVYNALTARQRLARYEQYQRNVVTARSWTEQCETSLQEISGKMADVREQLINAANTGIKNAGDRSNIAVLVRELRGTLVDCLNVNVGNSYIFSGFNTRNQPLELVDQPDGSQKVLYNGVDLTDVSAVNSELIQKEKDQHFQLEVGYGLQMDVTMTAIEVIGVGEDNLFQTLDNIIGLMDSGIESSEIAEKLSGYLDELGAAHENVTSCLVRTGAMTKQLDILDDRYSQDVINYNDSRSKIEDIDSAETIMDWKMAEAVYKQSLSTGARVIMPTLMDFLN